MKLFSIEIDDSGDLPAVPELASGRIMVGNFSESFQSPLGFWMPEDYRRNWYQAFCELGKSYDATSCFVSSMYDPATSNFIFCWPLYRKRDKVYVQNSIIFLSELSSEFDPATPWKHVQEHAEYDEDGNKISQWLTDFDLMGEFFGADEWQRFDGQ